MLESFVAVSNAVAFAHSRGVIHRDIKGQNVALGPYGEVVVLDWGLAKRLDRPDDPLAEAAPGEDRGPDSTRGATEPGQAIGTPNYMPPEQAAGDRPRIGERSDVFGLGALLYLVLTGRPPYDGGSSAEVIRLAIEARPPSPRSLDGSIPPALEAICLKAMDPQPERRYETAKEVGEEVRRWLADEPVEAYPGRMIDRAARWARHHQSMMAGSTAILITATVALALGAWRLGLETQKASDAAYRADESRKAAVGTLHSSLDGLSETLGLLRENLPLLPDAEGVRTQVANRLARVGKALTQLNDEDARVKKVALNFFLEAGNLHRMTFEFDLARIDYFEAIRLAREIAPEDQMTPGDRDRLAELHLEFGTMWDRKGDRAAAAEEYRQAGAIIGELRRFIPDEPNYRRTEGRILAHRASLLTRQGRAAEAGALMDQALERLLPDLDSPDRPYRLVAALSLKERGAIYRSEGRLDDSARMLRRALAWAESEAARGAPGVDVRFLLAMSRVELGRALALQPASRAEASGLFDRAIGEIAAIVEDRPQVIHFRLNLAQAHDDKGRLLIDSGQPEAADDEFRREAEMLKDLRVRFPKVRTLDGELARALEARARLALDLHRTDRASAWLQEAKALQLQPADPEDRATAQRIEEDLRRLGPTPPGP